MAHPGREMSRLPTVDSPRKNLTSAGRGLKIPVLTLGFLCIFAQWIAPAPKKIPPHTYEELAQAWIGISQDESYCFRLSLGSNGKGTGAYVYLDGQAHQFEVKSWSFNKKDQIELDIAPDVGTILEDPRVQGTVLGFRMELTFTGKGWKEKVLLRPEAPLKGKWDKLRLAMGIGLTS